MNKKLQNIIDRLQENIKKVSSEFLKYPEGELRRKPTPDKWSKKELLGHLVDSAANNHHRFIKAQFLPSPMFVEGYAQNDWVRIQNYNEKETKQLVELWKVYNEHIIFIMQNTPDQNLDIKLKPEDAFENADTLFFLMKDYVDHMDHHLKQIFG
ncbi:MAG: DinB superfamily protein [Ignavibacteriaceae bacterium]|nr:DinB superfamily protein [Ignavibacteriaceae bacterium]